MSERRIIPAIQRPQVVTVTRADDVLSDALAILEKEVIRYRNIVNIGKPLDPNQARIVQGYIKSLVELSRETRDSEKDKTLGNKDTTEIVKMFLSAMKPDDRQKLLTELEPAQKPANDAPETPENDPE